MLIPDTNNKKIKKCCKDERNLEFSYGDRIEWEVYLCDTCDNELYVPMQRQRFWEDAQYVEGSE